MSTLGAVIRLAGRGVRRQRLRSLLIAIMLAAPVTAAVALDVVLSSEHPSVAVATDEQIGAARAMITRASLTTPTGGPATGPIRLPPMSVPPADAAILEEQSPVLPYRTSGVVGQYVDAEGVDAVGVDLRTGVLAPTLALRSGYEPAAVGQVALTPALARTLGIGTADMRHDTSIGVSGSPVELRVIGIVANRYQRDALALYGLPATINRIATDATFDAPPTREWLVTGPSPLTQADRTHLSEHGLLSVSRRDIPAETGALVGSALPGGSATSGDPELIRGLITVMILLEIALLAGPAFAIGARRRRRELETLSVVGARRSHLVGVALADGALLGGVAALAGVIGGLVVSGAVVAAQRAWSAHLPDALTVPGWALAGFGTLALTAGLIAAIPSALEAGRAGAVGRRRSPLRSVRTVTVGLVVLGAAIVLAGTNLETTSGSGGPVALFAAAALGEIGLVLVTPGVLAVAGRAADRLTIWPRLALRDASRHRTAAVPAVAAIIAVVAATTAALVAGGSVAAHDRADYDPYSIVGDAQTEIGPGQAAAAATAVRALRHALPAADVLELRGAATCGLPGSGSRCEPVGLRPSLPGCPAVRVTSDASGGFAYSVGYTSRASASCTRRLIAAYASSEEELSEPILLVESGTTAGALLGGKAGRAARLALDKGREVVFSSGLVDSGRLTLVVGGRHERDVTLAATVVDDNVPYSVGRVILTPASAKRIGLSTVDEAIYVKHANRLTGRELAGADADLARAGLGLLFVQRGFGNVVDRQLLAIAGADLVLTVAAAVTSTALLTLDNEADLLILVALGAAARSRRRLAATRAGILCLVGAVFGVIAGMIPGIGFIWRLRHITTAVPGLPGYPLDLPWGRLVLVGLVAPLVAVAVAAVAVRAHPDLTRRDRR
jgi:putative ABC transport system permease protein